MATQAKAETMRTVRTLVKGLGLAALVLTPFACGMVEFLNEQGQKIRRHFHDHAGHGVNGWHVQDEHHDYVPYVPDKHGIPVEFVKEGEIITNYPTEPGFVNVHRHPTDEHPTAPYGPIDVVVEPVKSA